MITFRGGVDPNDGKEYTKDKQIEKLEASQEVVFLMKQHIGAPSIPVVKVKDEVHVGTLIAKAGGYVSANIMSSVSGIVKRIEKRQDASGHYQDAVVIENDRNYTSDYEAHENNIDALTFEEKIENPPAVARYVSDRHFGIGSDGLIMINPSEVADFEMEMYNADGSRGEMCGNGIRCVAKYVYDYGLTDKTQISVETLGGIKYLDLTVEDGKVSLVKVDMGKPKLEADLIPIISEREQVIDEPIEVDGKEYHMTGVSMGNPHAVIYVDDVKGLDLEKIGPKFENHERFPKRINTEFVHCIDRQTVEMRVWERGSGETLACGTGACAVAVSSILNNLTDTQVTVKLLGGDLQIEWDREKDRVFMTGPATVVFDGVIDITEIKE